MLPLIVQKTSVTTIPIADKPLRLGGVVRSVTQDDFCRIFGLPFQEGIWIDDALPKTYLQEAQKNINPAYPAFQLQDQIEEAINHPFKNICIAFIDSKVGYGTFATGAIKKAL